MAGTRAQKMSLNAGHRALGARAFVGIPGSTENLET
jgi:hypothetical protein